MNAGQTSEIKKIQKVEFNLLKRLVKILDENNLDYVLQYGTLLGAIRHKDFIPWDDDVDIAMPRPDYNKLLKIANNQVFDGISFSNWDFPFLKAYDRNYEIIEGNVGWSGREYAWVDIFPIDGMPEDQHNFKRLLNRKKILLSLFSVRKISIYNYAAKARSLAGVCKLLVRLLLQPIPVKSLAKYINKKAQKISYQDSTHAGVVVWCGPKNYFPKSKLAKITTVTFHGESFKAPKHYDYILRQFYGDYMKLPAPDERIAHNARIVSHK